jgi:hypothetical protein
MVSIAGRGADLALAAPAQHAHDRGGHRHQMDLARQGLRDGEPAAQAAASWKTSEVRIMNSSAP